MTAAYGKNTIIGGVGEPINPIIKRVGNGIVNRPGIFLESGIKL